MIINMDHKLIEIYQNIKTLNYKKIDEYTETNHELNILVYIVTYTQNVTVAKYLLVTYPETHKFITCFGNISNLVDYLFEFVVNLDTVPVQYIFEENSGPNVEFLNDEDTHKILIHTQYDITNIITLKKSTDMVLIQNFMFDNGTNLNKINQDFINKFGDNEDNLLKFAYYCRYNIKMFEYVVNKFKIEYGKSYLLWNFMYNISNGDTKHALCKCLLENDAELILDSLNKLLSFSYSDMKLIIEHYGEKLSLNNVVSYFNLYSEIKNNFSKKILLASQIIDINNINKQTIKNWLPVLVGWNNINDDNIETLISLGYADIIMEFLKEQLDMQNPNIPGMLYRSQCNVVSLIDTLETNNISCEEMIVSAINKKIPGASDDFIKKYKDKYPNIIEKIKIIENIHNKEQDVINESFIKITQNYHKLPEEEQKNISKSIMNYILEEKNFIDFNLLSYCKCHDIITITEQIDGHYKDILLCLVLIKLEENVLTEHEKHLYYTLIFNSIKNKNIPYPIKQFVEKNISLCLSELDCDSLMYLFFSLANSFGHNKNMPIIFEHLLNSKYEFSATFIDFLFITKMWNCIDSYIKFYCNKIE